MKKGFTLMELLIVIALIGILVTMGVASYSTAQIKSRDARRKADMKVFQNAYEQYYSENNGIYPITANPGTLYFPSGVPSDPKSVSPYVYNPTFNASGSPYYYCVCATIEGGTGGNANSETCGGMGSCSGAACTHYCVRNLQ